MPAVIRATPQNLLGQDLVRKTVLDWQERIPQEMEFKYISENYLTAGGKYYNGVSIDGIGKRYATDPNWSTAIKKHMANLLLT
jgi:hypothetical protein